MNNAPAPAAASAIVEVCVIATHDVDAARPGDDEKYCLRLEPQEAARFLKSQDENYCKRTYVMWARLFGDEYVAKVKAELHRSGR